MPVDYAKAQHLNSWLHHPVIGDPSWDTFEREPGNPIHTGSDPMLWTVNGFLFHDPVSEKWYSYIGLYPKGYWPCGDCLVMREKAGGGWEQIGFAIKGDANLFDGEAGKPGATPDVSVVYDNGKYHMVYDWGNNSFKKHGIAYAWADRPEGPFHRASEPLHINTAQTPILRRFQRTYAATLIKRRHDWIILAMTDSCIPGSGAWAMVGMTSKKPEGPYTAPVMLLYPQSEIFHPVTIEFFPAFTHDGFVFAPATSVALNRTYQAMFKAPLEKAHLESAWKLEASGSLWHSEPVPWEAKGIWGQTFAGQVTNDGEFRVLYPCKNSDDAGTISIATRKWANPYKDGFILSAPNATSYAILCKCYSDFSLTLQAESSGKWAVCWSCSGPLGTDSQEADAKPNPEMRRSRTELQVDDGQWSVVQIDDKGKQTVSGSGTAATPGSIRIVHVGGATGVYFDDRPLWSGKVGDKAGRIEIVGEAGSHIQVASCLISGIEEEYSELWLPLEAVAGCSAIPGEWKAAEDSRFRFGHGYVSTCKEAEAKWNFYGRAFKLHLPKGPDYGKCVVYLDGRKLKKLNLHCKQPVKSSVVFERKMQTGYHAVKIKPVEGNIPCDVIEVIREPAKDTSGFLSS